MATREWLVDLKPSPPRTAQILLPPSQDKGTRSTGCTKPENPLLGFDADKGYYLHVLVQQCLCLSSLVQSSLDSTCNILLCRKLPPNGEELALQVMTKDDYDTNLGLVVHEIWWGHKDTMPGLP